MIEILGHLAIAEHGVLTRGRLFGTLRDGGDFEAPVLRIQRRDCGRWVGGEVFEPEDVERARARFAELGREHAARARDPLRIPPNVARPDGSTGSS